MGLLLDTHAFIWWASDPEKLPAALLQRLMGEEPLLLSIASLWEMQIKIGLGKLALHQPLRRVVEEQQAANGLRLLPFDRLLIAQAHCDELILVSRDQAFDAYPIRRFWHG
ncbi:MAG: type II toxin-antitoxin system VapC family toxin [Rhodocyclaceae bacterium]|nr:type II toxin-antitoxin system VapC family toxin [Rhodocyclaceae bacterium]